MAARVLLTAALVLTLSAASGSLGPRLGGILAAFPVLASLLAAFTHAVPRRRPRPATSSTGWWPG